MEIKTLKQFLEYHRTVTKYAFGNKTNKEYWKGYKQGWIACMDNLLLESEDHVKLDTNTKKGKQNG